jgi:hypothetical protein
MSQQSKEIRTFDPHEKEFDLKERVWTKNEIKLLGYDYQKKNFKALSQKRMYIS